MRTGSHLTLLLLLLSRFSCVQLCNPIDSSPPGSPVPGILQARILEWVAISFSNVWKWKWSRSVVSDSYWPHGLEPTRLLCPWDSPGKRTGVGCHCLLHQWWLVCGFNGNLLRSLAQVIFPRCSCVVLRFLVGTVTNSHLGHRTPIPFWGLSANFLSFMAHEKFGFSSTQTNVGKLWSLIVFPL